MTPLEFKAARNRLRMSQQALADALGRHRSIVARYEAGVYPVPKSVELALEALEGRDELLDALSSAAQSLETISRQAGRDEFMAGMDDVRAYANSRARAAREALAAYRKGGEV